VDLLSVDLGDVLRISVQPRLGGPPAEPAAGRRSTSPKIRRALASDAEPWEAYTEFLRRIVAANTHGLTVRLAGMFVPSEEQMALAEQMQAGAVEMFERVRGTGRLRDDVTFLDVEFMLEFLAGFRLGDAARSAGLRQRYLAVIIDGLRSGQQTPLPGHAPTWHEQTERWIK
jgi:hypothetical protein